MEEALTIAEWKTAIANAHWDINYAEFCRRAGFAEDEYAERKWRDWLELVSRLNQFDAATLARIVQPNGVVVG